MSNMTRKSGHRIWLETPAEVTTATNMQEMPKKYRSAHHGLVATYEDALQGIYMVEASSGAHWLVAKGADGDFDIITRPDKTSGEPRDGRIIASVKAYITRNER
jgi:hypothetical protein